MKVSSKVILGCILLGLSTSGFALDLPPVRVPIAVPEAGSSLLLLAIGVAGIAGLRRWLNRSPKA